MVGGAYAAAMDIDWGDAAAWAAFVIAVISASFAWRSVGEAKKSRVAAERAAAAGEVSAQAAVRSADAEEKAHQLAERQYQDSLPPAVAWQIEKAGKSWYVLRNIGTDTALDVTVDLSALAGALVQGAYPPEHTTIASGVGHRFMLGPDSDSKVPDAVVVTWAGASAPATVGLPS